MMPGQNHKTLASPGPLAGCLDLDYLATGYHQHVFIRTKPDTDQWVYKIPAAYGYVLPFHPVVQGNVSPNRLDKKIIHWLVLRLPESLHNRVRKHVPTASPGGSSNPAAAPWLLADRALQAVRAGRDKLMAAYFRRSRARAFEAMLALMEDLSLNGPTDLLLPYSVIRHGQATLRVAGGVRYAGVVLSVDDIVVPYHGVILMQRKADMLDACHSFKSFNWQELVEAQHRLWRSGFFAFDCPEIPMSWALLEGRIRLADTSSLTRDFHSARQFLNSELLANRERVVLSRQIGSDALETAREYYRFIRAQVNPAKLAEHWGKDLNSQSAPVATSGVNPHDTDRG
jgi:hypothetical protein